MITKEKVIKLTEKAHGKEFKRIKKLIFSAAKSGKTSVHLGKLSNDIVRILNYRGFWFTYDQNNEYEITWGS